MRNWFDRSSGRAVAPRSVRPLARYRYVRLRWRAMFALIDAIGYVAAWGLGSLRPAGESWLKAGRSPRSILLVQLDHLGDAILSTGLLRGLRSAYPHARIDVLASAASAELFCCLAEVDRVFLSPLTRFASGRTLAWILATLRWGWRLRRQRYDLAIDPRGDFPTAVILWLCGAPVRLGWGSGGGGFLLTHEAEFDWGRHEVLSRQALLDLLFIASPDDEPAWPPRFVPWAAARKAIAQTYSTTSRLVLLHVGAGTAAKRWPQSHWQELIGRLILEHNPQIVLVGSAAEGQGMAAMPGVINRCGQLSIDELAAMLERADLLIGGDSGPAHLAAAVGTPAVVLFSGTNRAEQWRPWGEQVRVLKHPTTCSPCHRHSCPLANHPCMNGLRPESVVAAASEFLEPTDCVNDPHLERTVA